MSYDSIIIHTLLGVSAVAFLVFFYFNWMYTYWSRKKFPFLPPKFPYGQSIALFNEGIGVGTPSKIWYDKLKEAGHKFGGIWGLAQPILVLVDPDYVKDIMTSDFTSFTNRGIYYNPVHDPLSFHLFSMDDVDWRKMRIKLTPTFTSGKMKLMFNVIVDCSKNLISAIDKFAQDGIDVDTHEVAGCYTTDVIGTCAFGVNCNSFKDPHAEFRTMGKRIFEIGFLQSVRLCLSIYAPSVAYKLGLTTTHPDVTDFFIRIIKETVEFRQKNNITRTDFLQLLIDMMGKGGEDSGKTLTMNEISAQSFLFFVAGFETSSTTMNYMLLELADNIEAQDKLRTEIRKTFEEHKGEFTYEAIMEMKYLSQCIDETLRLYPPVPTLNRLATKDYKLKNTDLVVEKGTPVYISTLGLHRDPEYYPDPLKYDPDRFSDENKKKRHPYAYIPFGDGPRNCIGLRFGLMQVKLGLAMILKDYRVRRSPKTTKPVELNPHSFVLFPKNKIYLQFEKITN